MLPVAMKFFSVSLLKTLRMRFRQKKLAHFHRYDTCATFCLLVTPLKLRNTSEVTGAVTLFLRCQMSQFLAYNEISHAGQAQYPFLMVSIKLNNLLAIRLLVSN